MRTRALREKFLPQGSRRSHCRLARTSPITALGRTSVAVFVAALIFAISDVRGQVAGPADTAGNWVKYEHNPVIGEEYGTLFDVCVLRENDVFRMWVSWLPQKGIALVESKDGIHFSGPPRMVLGPASTGWEDQINRPAVVRREDGYHLWYTGQSGDGAAIGYATSPDGTTWTRASSRPVLSPSEPWEKAVAMCADVMWDRDANTYRMWYSAGRSEPDSIGYASSPDGVTWTKTAKNPVFSPDPNNPWEADRTVGCHVEKLGGWYYMFYIGFHDIGHAQLGVARSHDGITNWQRLPQNPVVRLGTGKWDNDSCYKPYTVFDGSKWLLWYGGRNKNMEQIGLVTHDGADLGFPLPQ